MLERSTVPYRSRTGALAAWVLACGLALAAPSSAEEPGAKEPEAPATAPKPEPAKRGDELVCKRERVVGSHIPKRTCRTRAQVEAERDLSRQTMGDLEKTGGPNREGPPGS